MGGQSVGQDRGKPGLPPEDADGNGPELVSLTLAQWAGEHGVILKSIKPVKPMQNAFIKRFNRTCRTEILDFYLFRTLNEAGKKSPSAG